MPDADGGTEGETEGGAGMMIVLIVAVIVLFVASAVLYEMLSDSREDCKHWREQSERNNDIASRSLRESERLREQRAKNWGLLRDYYSAFEEGEPE